MSIFAGKLYRKTILEANDTYTAWVWFFSGFMSDSAVFFVAKLNSVFTYPVIMRFP